MTYDYVFVTNCPSFYKINLYNELSIRCNIFVVFIGITNEVVIDVDFESKIKFPFILLNNDVHINKRNKFLSMCKLVKVVLKLKYNYIVLSGWDFVEYISILTFTSKRKNCIVSESSIYESQNSFLKLYLKKLILSRVSYAFVAGQPHKNLLQKFGFKGNIYVTGGVGLINKSSSNFKINHNGCFKYIFVGRLIKKKYIEQLVDIFNSNGKYLTIVGAGILLESIKLKAKSNIKILGYVDNAELPNLLCNHSGLILPSLIEPWGLVVEEALYYGLPVLVSDNVGCNIDLVKNYNSGVVFDSHNKSSIENGLIKFEEEYKHLEANVQKIDFQERNMNQVDVYMHLLK